MKKNRKGFTIVELVIVIAVIAILAAVLIPTFANLIQKANLSNDQQMVANMNKTLAVEFAAGKPKSAGEAYNALSYNGYYGDKLNTYSKGYHYAYNLENNKMYLVNDKKAVVYPDNKASLGSLWTTYGDYNSDYVDGITNYVATTSITNAGYFNVFNNGTYTIDLNNNVMTVESENADNITLLNGFTTATGYDKVEEVKEMGKLDTTNVTSGAYGDIVTISDAKVENKVIDLSVDYTVVFKETDTVIFENCVFKGAVGNKPMMGLSDNNKNLIIRNCTFVEQSDNWAININLYGSNSTITIENNKFINCRRGINIQEFAAGKIIIDGNTFNLNDSNVNKRNAIQITTIKSTDVAIEIKNNKFETANAAVVIHVGAVETSFQVFKAEYVTFANNTLGKNVKAVVVDPDYKTDLKVETNKTAMENLVAELNGKFN